MYCLIHTHTYMRVHLTKKSIHVYTCLPSQGSFVCDCLKIEGSSYGSTVVSGVMGEAGGRGDYHIITRLERTDDGWMLCIVYMHTHTFTVDVFQNR